MTTNVSKEKREKLVEKINAIKTYIQSAPQDENTSNLLDYIAEVENDIKGKKYGLIFEKHKEKIDEMLENNVPVLKEDRNLFIDNGGQINFLIEGDNLASLKLLEKTHKGKIDLIYIDPPYNTGSKDFIYDDTFIENSDLFSHSKWLSFMEKRLNIAKELLSERGVIFISIDDNEQSVLKLLCDNVFASENFIGTLIHQRAKGGGQAKHIVKGHDYILLFAKKIKNVKLARKKVIQQKTYNINGEQYIKNDDVIRKSFGKYDKSLDRRCFYEQLIQYKGEAKKQEIDKKLANGDYFLEENKDGYHVICEYIKVSDATSKLYSIIKVLSEEGKNDLVDLNITNFSYPKPVELIRQIIESSTTKNSSVLDFFAGSGTTGQAVMQLNAEDNGSRKFILCTNNENNICKDVTYERIKRVIEKKDYKASLKYIKVDFISISDKFYYEYADELLKHIKELVELENAINFDNSKEVAIILKEHELDKFTESLPPECKVIYLGHDILPTDEQERLFKKNKIKINIIPDYYYRVLEG